MKIKSAIYPLVIMGTMLILAISCQKNVVNNDPTQNETVTDMDGNVYQTVTIGTQVWMAENLKTTKYRNGDPIPNVTDGSAWGNLTTGAYCNNKNDANISTTYGRFYNWYSTSDIRNIAPTGWHIPTDAELTILITYLGGESISGGKLKETGTSHWLSPNFGATNSSGFSALPGGFRNVNGVFLDIGSYIYWWSTTENNTSGACYLGVVYDFNGVVRLSSSKKLGISVRCLKD